MNAAPGGASRLNASRAVASKPAIRCAGSSAGGSRRHDKPNDCHCQERDKQHYNPGLPFRWDGFAVSPLNHDDELRIFDRSETGHPPVAVLLGNFSAQRDDRIMVVLRNVVLRDALSNRLGLLA